MTMKKKLLFVIPSLDSGGGEKALVNLLNTLDYSKVDVTLLLFKKHGLFLNLVPNQVEIKTIDGNYTHFTKSIFASVLYFLSQFNFKLIVQRKLYFIKRFFIKSNPVFEQQSWINISKSISSLTEKYDVAISFLEKASLYYVVDKVVATKKIAWIHTNYSNSGLNPNFDAAYFNKIDTIVTVSAECEENFKQNFPSLKDKSLVIDNIVSNSIVQKLAETTVKDEIFQPNNFTIITVARLSEEKGIDLAVETCKLLVENNNKVKWYVIGDGKERKNIEALIEKHNLQNNFFLLGLKSNPYYFVKKASVYVQPSRYEGKSIAIDEAKILCKPILTTNYTTAKDQIENGVNGIISGNNPKELAFDIESVLNDVNLQKKLTLHLQNNQVDKSNVEVDKFYKIISD